MQVEIWSDIVCPWCAIGKRRFEAALARFDHRAQVQVRWRSFELEPGAPREHEGEGAARLAAKYGVGLEQARSMNATVTDAAAAEGWEFHLDSARGGNTTDAHRLLHLAADHDVQGAVKERLMRAYFVDGERIGDPETLVRLVAEVGLDPEEARGVLASDRYRDAVRADEEQARAYGITGVPFFVVDGRYGVSGAQSADALLQVLEQAWAESRPSLVTAGGEGETCADGSCAR